MGRRALLAGGGSGGHVFPGLAVAEALERRGWQVSFAGTAQGMEARLALSQGLEFHSLPAKPLRGRNPIQGLGALATLARSTVSAVGLIRRLGADVVIATGGYVCVSAGLAARLCRLPLILVEPNAEPGLANRLLGRFASSAAVAWQRTADALPCSTELTGVPVRRSFFEVDRPALGAPWKILVLGGSQGAQSLNVEVPPVLHRLVRDGDRELEVVHQAGSGKEAATESAYMATDVKATVVPFIDNVAEAMADCHLVLSRAGAVTLAEICAAGRPSILFPLSLAGGHQGHNAAALHSAGAARVVDAMEIDPEKLRLVLLDVLDAQRLEAMSSSASQLARSDAAEAIASLVEAEVSR
ncbi:MAG: undecaprenyldiphospho-muramoylpentapeptide beta-N-acetylglucosaminyltransferase [Acidobacteriota bacterium]|nr:undecaprenyldiphospho-muramoylpentapeptide beta-N-acetylglucosaminyltransferase [Acidobacteriota bacterium]